MNKIFYALRYIFLALGLGLYFIGARYFYNDDFFLRYIIPAYSFLALSFVPLLRDFFRDARSGFIEHRRIVILSMSFQFMTVIGIIMNHLYLGLDTGGDHSLVSHILLGSWISFLTLGLLGSLGTEIGIIDSGDGDLADSVMVSRYSIRWLNIALLLLSLVAINYVAVKTDKMVDLSYLKVTEPSSGTIQVIGNLEDVLIIEAYFPYDNEVLPDVKTFLDKLPKDRVKVKILDKDLNPKEAEESKVSRNGQMVIRVGDKLERISIGSTQKKAKKTLKKLDQTFQKSLQKISTNSKSVYFTRDHGEMEPNSSLSDLRRMRRAEALLKSQNFVPKRLDSKSGLFQTVPADAALVVIAGPSLPFVAQEIEVLLDYLQSGGSILLALDREFEDSSSGVSVEGLSLRKMVGKVGIEVLDGRVANDKKYVTATRTKADKWFLVTNLFGSHPAVESLSKHDNKLRVLARNSEALSVKKIDGWKVDELIKTFGDSYLDLNLNSEFDKDKERKKIYPISVSAEHLASKSDGKGKIIVLSDATMISDLLLNNNPGNQVMFLDSVRWLTGDESIVSSQSSEEDVLLTHAKEEHLVIFYASVFVVPGSVLLLGFFATRRRKNFSEEVSDA